MKLGICFFWCFALGMLVVMDSRASDEDNTDKNTHNEMSENSDSNSPVLTIDRIFHEKQFDVKGYAAQWIDGTDDFTVLRSNDENKKEQVILRCHTSDQKFTPLLASKDLVPEEGKDPLKIEGYEFSKDLSRVLIYTNSKRVWRTNSRGDYWLFDFVTRELKQLGGDGPPATMMFAKFDPVAQRIAYVRDRNIFIEDLSTHQIECITKRDSEEIINGTTDWVYEEEFGVRDGFRWSPDGKYIAYWQLDTTGVNKFPLVNNTDTLYPEVTWFAYPKVGEMNSACRIGIADCETGETQWVKLPGDNRNQYVARIQWADNSYELLVQHLNRLQNCNQLYLAKSTTGDVTKILKEEDAAWVDVHDELFWVDDGRSFTWVSDRDGWRHVYLASRSGDSLKLLTPGEFDVIKLLKVDEACGCFYFIASPDDATQRFLYRGFLDGQPMERITPADARGVHDYQFSDSGKLAIHRTSHADWPGHTELISLPDHKSLRVLEDNAEVVARVNKLDRAAVEFFRVDIGDGIEFDSWCIKPANLDPNKKYPLLIYVYGEPAGTTVVDSWGRSTGLWHTMLAQQGYVVMSFDNRGTRVPRGRDWRKSIYKKIGILPPKDQAAAVEAVLRDRPYLDPKRVGIWGWSGGGSSSLQAIFKYPDLYSTAIAVAPVPDQRYYDTIYQERYMGLPSENPEAFKEGSAINFADQLNGNLLLIHGTGDDNCHYQTVELLIDKLIASNKQFSLMAYPNRTHAIKERENTQRHLRELMTQYLLEHLPVND